MEKNAICYTIERRSANIIMKTAARKKFKKIILISGAVCLVIVLLCLAFVIYVYFSENTVKNYAEKWISKKVNASVDIGSLDYGLFPFNVHAEKIRFYMDDTRSRIELSIDAITGKGDTLSLLSKGGRLFDSIEVNGLDLDVRVKQSRDGKTGAFDSRDLPQQITPLINRVNRLNLKNISACLVLSKEEKLNWEGAELTILSRIGGEGLDFSFSSRKYSTEISSPLLNAGGTMNLTGHLDLLPSPLLETDLTLENQSFSSSRNELLFLPDHFNFNVNVKSDLKKRADVSDLSLMIPQICDLTGKMTIDISGRSFLSFNPHIKLPELKNILDPLRPYLPAQLSTLYVKGSAELDLKGWLYKKEADMDYSVEGDLALDPSRVELTYKEVSSSLMVGAGIAFKASQEQEEFNGEITCSQGLIRGNGWELKGLDLNLPLSGSREQIQILELVGFLKEFSYDDKDRSWKQEEIQINGSISGDLKNSVFHADTLDMVLPPLGEFKVIARFSPDPSSKNSFYLLSPNIRVSDAITRFRAFIPDDLSVWEPEGMLHFELSAAGRNVYDFDLKTKTELNELSFHDPTFSIAGESISLDLAIQAGLTPDESRMPFSLEVSLFQGETLLRDLYVKWEDHLVKTDLQGWLDARQKVLDIDSFTLQTELLGDINGKGRIAAGDPLSADLSLKAARIDPVKLLGFVGQEFNEDSQDIQIKGEGDVIIDIRKRGPDLSFKGNIGFHNGFFEAPAKKILLSGLDVDLPFFLEMGFSPFSAWDDFWFERGSLKIGHLQVNGLNLDRIQLDLLAARNLFLSKPVEIQLYEGTASIYNSLVRFDRYRRSFNGVTALLLQGGKIERLVPEKPDLPLNGIFHVDMPRITIDQQKITTAGQMQIDVFQGRATVTDVKIDRPFSKNRTFFCDLEFRNFNLEKLTDSMAFGKVTGFIEGEVNDLAVSYGQPEQFSLRIDSVEKKGMPQRFSMKAVDDISILSSGEKTSMGSAELLSHFVSSFRYKKIGIFCSLKNDNFTLRGTIKENGKEILVKKDWIFGISVVNAEPDNLISFQDMMNRLQRIGKSS